MSSSPSFSRSSQSLHFVLVPFMSKGHTIPQLYLARLLSQRNLLVTIFSTPENTPFIHSSLTGTSVTIKELPFTENYETSVSNNFSNSHFHAFISSTKTMQTSFEQALEALLPVHSIIYDMLLVWSQQSAEKFGIPTLVFTGMSNFASTLSLLTAVEKESYKDLSDDQPFSFPSFPSLKLYKYDFEKAFIDPNPDDPWVASTMEIGISSTRSRGMLVNSLYELETDFHDYWNAHFAPRAWCIGPLCLASPKADTVQCKSPWLEWLDQKQDSGKQVLFVSLGSQPCATPEQLVEIARGLEESNECFLWALKESIAGSIGIELKERVQEKGLIISNWVDQMAILEHGSICGFLSHCGWNSITEAICAGKPILALPMMAEQHLNARITVDEFGIGLRIPAINGSAKGFVGSKDVAQTVKELMCGDGGRRASSKAKKLREAAQNATKEGGSSWCTLNKVIDYIKVNLSNAS